MGMFDSAKQSAAETLVNKTFGAVSDRIKKTWDDHKEHNKRLEAIKSFCSKLCGMTEEMAKERVQIQNLSVWTIRRNGKDFSCNGRMEKRFDRIMLEVDDKVVTNAYLG
jgi:hypothetical protein